MGKRDAPGTDEHAQSATEANSTDETATELWLMMIFDGSHANIEDSA